MRDHPKIHVEVEEKAKVKTHWESRVAGTFLGVSGEKTQLEKRQRLVVSSYG